MCVCVCVCVCVRQHCVALGSYTPQNASQGGGADVCLCSLCFTFMSHNSTFGMSSCIIIKTGHSNWSKKGHCTCMCFALLLSVFTAWYRWAWVVLVANSLRAGVRGQPLLNERFLAWLCPQKDILDVSTIMKELASMVHEQGDAIGKAHSSCVCVCGGGGGRVKMPMAGLLLRWKWHARQGPLCGGWPQPPVRRE